MVFKCYKSQLKNRITKPNIGIDEFNENIFSDKIKEITIPEWYKVTFVFWDGERVTKVWRDKSRKWTDEMKAENYDKLRKGHKS